MSKPIVSARPEMAKVFEARFVISAKFGSILVEPEHDYARRHGGQEGEIFKGLHLVRIDNGIDGPIHLDAAEALQVAAAVQAVAVDLLEQQPREITRRTEPGAPGFEDLGAAS